MIDINALDFIEDFKIDQATIGVVGYGYVGRAVSEFFLDHCTIKLYDRAFPNLGTLNELVKSAEVIFICVPTPMSVSDGSCHTGIVQSVISDIEQAAYAIGRNPDSFVCVIKSTVSPGFTKSMRDAHPELRIVFSPEFLTEKNSVIDFRNSNRIIVGGDPDDATVVLKYFMEVQPKRVENGQLLLLHCDSSVAEMVKLFTNGMLMTKVLFANEIYQICKTMKIDFEDVRGLAAIDPRVGGSHTSVPGHDGMLGAGGHCFPKDINNLRDVCRKLGIKERMFTAVIERNDELREDKDWLAMAGRAVIG
jgi:UDPglucose 6-dehydrogenase